MTKREEILLLRKKLKDIEEFEKEEQSAELKQLAEKEIARDLRELRLDEIIDEELIPGKIGIKTSACEDILTDYDPIVGKAWEGKEVERKKRIGYGESELEIDDDVREAVSVGFSPDEVEARWK